MNRALTDFSKFSDAELAESFIFPVQENHDKAAQQNEDEFWLSRRKQFEARTPEQQIHDRLLQLKFQMEDYINDNRFEASLNFGFYLNEYIKRQGKQDKQFATEVDVKPAVLSQYLNNHRNPTEKFIIRLELHSNKMISALSWLKLLQKDKEHDIVNNTIIRKEESKHIKNRLAFTY